MADKLLDTIVTVVVGIIFIGSLLTVVISDYSTSELTITNEGMPYASAGGEHTIIVDPNGIEVDGTAVDVTKFPGNFSAYTLVYGETSFVRWNPTTNVLIAGVGLDPHQITIAGNKITITLNDSSLSISNTLSADVYTASDALFYISPTGGNYTLALNPYVSKTDTVYGAGDTYFTTGMPANVRTWLVWSGVYETITIDGNGIYGTAYNNMTVTDTVATLSNPTSNLYKYESVVIDFTITYASTTTDYDLTSTFTYFLAPTTVSYDNPSYIGDGTASLLGAIVIISIAAILLLSVRMMMGRRD